MTYLDELKQKGKLAIESRGVQVYIEPVQKGDVDYTVILKKDTTVVFFSSLKNELVQAASDEIVKKLAQAPTGPTTTEYPALYSKLTSACALLPAADFERLLQKPASSLATETLALTEVEKDTASRECTRIEVERLKQGEITNTRISLFESRTEPQAKERIAAIKSKEGTTVTALKDLGDEAYAIATDRGYSIVIRSGKVALGIKSDGETKDTNVGAFLSRTQPIAALVFANYKKLQ
jgi:predicted Fe-Mo cluster-binding NifX family protein